MKALEFYRWQESDKQASEMVEKRQGRLGFSDKGRMVTEGGNY